MLDEFKKFLMRGNVVDLAVAVVIGVAFGAVITSFVDGVINPIIGLAGGKDMSAWVITLKDESGNDPAVLLRWGSVLTAVVNFLMVAAAIFFLVIKPLNVLAERRKRGEATEEEAAPTEAELLIEIRDLLASRSA